MPDNQILSAGQLWHAALGELMLQMTKATFDTWVKPTFAVAYTDGKLVVGVRNAYAKQWLENRLYGMIQRTLAHITGRAVEVKFELKTTLAPYIPGTDGGWGTGEASVVPADAGNPTGEVSDLSQRLADAKNGDVLVDVLTSPLVPFLMVQKYAIYFWRPLLGQDAFDTWEVLRAHDRTQNEISQKWKISVEMIAATLPAHRQRITGVERHGKWQPGAFDVLNREGLARITPIGRSKWEQIWYAMVLNEVPLLTPKQLSLLPPLIAERHERYLLDWRYNQGQWEQLTLDSLIKPHFAVAEAQVSESEAAA